MFLHILLSALYVWCGSHQFSQHSVATYIHMIIHITLQNDVVQCTVLSVLNVFGIHVHTGHGVLAQLHHGEEGALQHHRGRRPCHRRRYCNLRVITVHVLYILYNCCGNVVVSRKRLLP